jgi:hypothetical protein
MDAVSLAAPSLWEFADRRQGRSLEDAAGDVQRRRPQTLRASVFDFLL